MIKFEDLKFKEALGFGFIINVSNQNNEMICSEIFKDWKEKAYKLIQSDSSAYIDNELLYKTKLGQDLNNT